MFFHGSEHKINKFTDDFVGGKEANDQQGPGIYFTSSWKNARWYGPYIYTVKLNPKKAVSTQDGKKAPLKQIEWLMRQAPRWEIHATNFHENPEIGIKIAAKGVLEYNENPHQQFLQVWIDFYRDEPVDYVRNMVKLGYDIIYITDLESMVADESNITHAIVLNPNIIEFVKMEDDRDEEEKKKDTLNEIRKFVRKTLSENNVNDNFWKWFDGSKVVDKNGNPLPVHHGTAKKFSSFSLKNAPQPIIWFTSNKSSIEAGEVGAAGKGHIMDLYASIKNPAGWDEYEKYGLGQLKSMGYDGAILPDEDGSITGFVFEPTQLKSVKNKGEWSTSNKSIYKEDDKYRGAHRMHKDSTSSPLYDLLQSGQVAKDFYENIHHYAYLHNKSDQESVNIIKQARNKPDAVVTIYRAVPKGVNEINAGDWVSLSKSYAKHHGLHHEDPKLNMPVISKKVKVKDVWWDGNDVNEFSYFPESLSEASNNKNEIVPPNIPNSMNFWHGGNLDSYDDIIAQKTGRYEFGPGLYATTSYEVVKRYAKGSRKLYLLTIEKGVDIEDAFLDLEKVTDFINSYVMGAKRKAIMQYLSKYIENGKVPASIFNNLILNHKAIQSTKTKFLRSFLVANGIDYEMVDNAFGFGEKMVVLYNMNKIINQIQIKPGDKIQVFDLPRNFN